MNERRSLAGFRQFLRFPLGGTSRQNILTHSKYLPFIGPALGVHFKDLSGTDLFDSTLTGADFSDAIIQGAGLGRSTEIGFTESQLYATASYHSLKDLSGVNLAANDLKHWDFSGQNLTGARFAGSSLSFTNFEQAEIVGADFAETTARAFHRLQLYSTASYRRKDLRGVRLSSNDLTGWDFHGQDLTNASLSYSTVAGADFSDATITNLFFYEATQWGFTKEQLYSTASYKQKNLKGILISGNLSGWDFSGQDLSNARLGGNLINAGFSGAWVSGAHLGTIRAEQLASTASYQAKNLRGISLAPDSNQHWDLRGQDLTDADLTRMPLSRVDLAGAVIQGVDFQNVRLLSTDHIYPTASYKNYDLRRVNWSQTNLEHWNFANQDLTGAAFYTTILKNVDFAGATIEGAFFGDTTSRGFTKEQLYSTASYQAKELSGIGLSSNNLNGWNLSGQDLTNGLFHSFTMNQSDLSFADTRGAMDMDLASSNVRNMIHSDGSLVGLELNAGERLVVRNYLGNPNDFHLAPMPIVVLEGMSATDGALRILFDAESWNSTFYFQEGISVQLGGTLELEFATSVPTAMHAGQTFQIFDWTGVSPSGQFAIQSSLLWDASQLHTLGVVTLVSGQAGDANGDGAVNVADLNAVRNNFGATGAPGLSGDAIPYDGVVNVSDLNAVRNNFGAAVAVPEPSSLMLVVLGVLILSAGRARARSSHVANRPAS